MPLYLHTLLTWITQSLYLQCLCLRLALWMTSVKSCNETVDRSPSLIPFVTCHKRRSMSYPVLCGSKSVTFRPCSDMSHTGILPEKQTWLQFVCASHSERNGHPFSNYWYWLMEVRVIMYIGRIYIILRSIHGFQATKNTSQIVVFWVVKSCSH